MKEKLSRKDLHQLAKTRAACLCHNLRRSSRAVTRLYDEAMAPAGLPANQMAILVGIALLDRPILSVLAQEMAMDPSTLSRNVKRLERDGLLRIATGAKQREKELSLTPKGIRQIKQALPFWAKAQAKLTKRMEPGLQEDVLAALADLTSNAQAMGKQI
ncbi:MAG: MarR family winged helix-turn-helix transcriptional regulator [Alphaproteobacteria bacterium]